jgi:hypothetical protein
MSEPKQVCFFNEWILKRDLEWYWKHFDTEGRQEGLPVRGEVTPFYARLSSASICSIARLLPDIQILLTVRNPIDRCWSGAHLDLGHYGKRRLQDISPGTFFRYFERARVRRYTEYVDIIRRWREAFGERKIHVSLFDDISRDPVSLLKDVYAHIGADPSWEIPLDQVASPVRPEGSDRQDHQMPDIIRWYLADMWIKPTRELNNGMDGRLDHWVDEMSTVLESERSSWRLKRALLGKAASCPEKISFALYDSIMENRLGSAWSKSMS